MTQTPGIPPADAKRLERGTRQNVPWTPKRLPGHHSQTLPAYSLLCVEGARGRGRPMAGAIALYLLLFLLGWMEGLIGCFEFSRSLGPFPVGALAFCVLILATCVLAGIGTGSPLGALVPALGWFAASMMLSLPTTGGSVIVTDTSAGRWYLYGGAVCAGLGIVSAFGGRVRRSGGGRAGAGI